MCAFRITGPSPGGGSNPLIAEIILFQFRSSEPTLAVHSHVVRPPPPFQSLQQACFNLLRLKCLLGVFHNNLFEPGIDNTSIVFYYMKKLLSDYPVTDHL